MPIIGLTNAPKAFLKLGQIRKGDKVPTADGKGTKPVDLDYFRVTFHPDCKDVQERFLEVYGPQPRRINIRFAFPSILEVWDANYECYAKGGLIAKASEDESGLHWVFYRDHADGEVLVRNGQPVGDRGTRLVSQPIDITKPVYSYKAKDGDVDVFLEPVGRLNVVVPEVAYLRVGYFEFRPGSPKDIRAISAELAGIDAWAKSNGKSIMAIPMVLTRREEDMTKNIGGKLSRGTSWLVHLEVGGEWGTRALTAMEHLALPDVVEGVAYDDWDAPELEATEPAPVVVPPAPEPPKKPSRTAAETAPATSSAPKRPYSPEEFKGAFKHAVEIIPAAYAKRDEKLEVSDDERKILASALDGILGGIMERHEFCSWLMGTTSTKDMTPAEIKTLLKIMEVKAFNEPPSTHSIAEIRACHKYAISSASRS